MRYLTHYEEYPIYEHAECGYYYPGNEIAETKKLSKRQAKKEMDRIWEYCKKENIRDYGCEEPYESNGRIYPWIRVNSNRIVRFSYYVGEGESYVIERKCGKEVSGRVTYC